MVAAETLRHEHFDRLSEQLIAAVTEGLFDLQVDQSDLAFATHHYHAVGRAFDDLAESFLSSFPFGDIDDAGQYESAFVRIDRIEADLDRHFAAVLVQTKEVTAHAHRAGRWSTKKILAVTRMSGAIAFGHQHLQTLSQQLGPPIPKELFGLRIHESDAPICADHHHRAGRRFDHQTKAFLGAPAFGDVDNAGQHEGAFFSLDRVKSDLDWNFAAVLVPAKQVTTRTHRASRRSLKKTCAMTGMRASVAFGHQHFHRLVQELGPRVADQMLRLCVYQSDADIDV